LLNYDANGSLVTKQVDTGTTTYGWDELNRLKSVSVPYASPALAQSYTYDPLGRRIAKTANGVTTNTLFDGPDPLAGVHALYSSWTQPDSLIAQGEATDRPLARLPLSGGVFQATFDYHANGLGSVAAISQETSGGDVPQIVRVFEPWGMTMSTVGTAAAQAAAIADPNWQGRERDETGLSNFRARYYDAGGVNGSPLIGRFISRDPAGFAAGISLYAFGGNDPINMADPSGMTALSPAALTAGINGLMQDAKVSDFMNQMGLGGLSSSNQSLAYSAPTPNYSSGNTLATVQTTLAAASFVPGLGTVTGLIGATIDVASGDFVAAGLSLASAVPIVGEAGAAARTGMAVERSLSAAERASQLANNGLTQIQRERFVTLAVTDTLEGTRVISSSSKTLEQSVIKQLQQGEVGVGGIGHAEVTGVEGARALGLTPTGVAASRPICSSCADYLNGQGIPPLTPLK
jgi:RHS repeat-associated protein